MAERSLCLVMIVKNESRVIKRALESVVDYIDRWVICDTGSSDNTKDIVKKFFKERDIPGELLEHKWVNFGVNRSEAVQAAKDKADYLLLMDADFVFIPKDKDFKKKMTGKGYLIKYEGNLDYRQLLLVSGRYRWKYIGVTHEYIHCPDVHRYETNVNFDGFTFNHLADGGERSSKFDRDIRLLEEGLVKEPKNTRYMFYLAQSYKDNGNNEKAVEWYQKRIDTGGWDQENYYAKYQKAVCMYRHKKDLSKDVVDAYLDAYRYRPSRLEAIHDLVRELRMKGRHKEAFRYGIQAYGTSYPTDVLFIDKSVHKWKFLDELSIVAYFSGYADLAKTIYDRLFREKVFSKNDTGRVLENYRFYTSGVEKMGPVPVPVKDIVQKKKNNIEVKRFESLKKGDIPNTITESDKFESIIRDIESDDRVAIIIINYNMKERADALVRKIRNIVKHPHDIILVDNASDIVSPSEFTSVYLDKNIQTTNGWLEGLKHADMTEKKLCTKYFAYCFLITSGEIKTDKDLIAGMVEHMKKDDRVVGVHPALTKSSTTHWKQLITDGSDRLSRVEMIDNIFSCYRADWFNSIGRFDSSLTYAWGIDIETGYISRKQKKILLVDNRFLVEKITNIGYKLKRMNMTAEQRTAKASEQMRSILRKKYGDKWGDLLCPKSLFNKNSYITPKKS